MINQYQIKLINFNKLYKKSNILLLLVYRLLKMLVYDAGLLPNLLP